MQHIIWKETIGTICDRDDGKKASWICYKVDDQEYNKRVDNWYSHTVVGEKYFMHYNVHDPKEIHIDTWHPVFEGGEKTYFFRGKIHKVKKKTSLQNGAIVEYSYKIFKDDVIEGWTELPDNYTDLYPNLNEGQYYNVQVGAENIHRVVLRLDLPILSKPGNKNPDRTAPLK